MSYALNKGFVSCSNEDKPSVCIKADRENWLAAFDDLGMLSVRDGLGGQAIALNRAALDWKWGDGTTKVESYYDPASAEKRILFAPSTCTGI